MALFRKLAGWHACAVWLAVGWLCAVTPAHAQVTWSGTGSNSSWSTSGNWSTALGNNFSAALVFDGTNNLTNTNDRTSGTATGITFNAGAGAFTIGGEAITLGGNITNSTSFKQTINNDLSIAATRTLTGTIAGGELVLGGNISGAGGLQTGNGPASSTSTLTLSGSNSFQGNVTTGQRVNLNINHAYALGSGNSLYVRNTGTVSNTSGVDLQLSGRHDITINGNDGSATFTLPNSLDFGDSTFYYSKADAFSLTVNGAGTLSLGSLTPATGSLSATFTKYGAGGLTLRNAAATGMVGAVTLSAGMVQLGHDRSLGDGSITFSAGVLQAIKSARNLSNTVSLSSGTISGAYDFTFAGPVTGVAGGGRSLTNNLSSNATLTIANLGLNAETANSRTLTISGSGNTLITGTISDGNASKIHNLTIDNTGITTISGSSSYGGTTQVNAGTLVFRSTAAKAAGTVTVAAAGSIGLGVGGSGYYISSDVAALFGNTLTGFSMNASSGVAADTTAGDFTISNALAGSRAFAKVGANTLSLTASNAYTGTTRIDAGTLQLGNNTTTGQLSTSSGITGAAGATLAFNRTNAVTQGNDFADGIGGGIGVSQVGSGQLTLSSSNNYSGGTRLSAGQLNINHANALGSGTVTISGGSIDNTSAAAIQLATNNVQAWNGDFTFVGTKNLDLGTGAVTLSANRRVTTTTGTLTAGGAISGAFDLTKAGAGTLALSGSNTYGGITAVEAGTLAVRSNAALPASAAIVLGTGSTSATLSFGNSTGSARSITFNGTGSQVSAGGKLNLLASGTNDALITVASGSHALHPDTTLQSNTVIDVAANSIFSLHGTIDGSKSLTKIGSGTMTVFGANTYSGGTWISGGYVKAGNSGALGSGTVTISGNAVLDLGNNIVTNLIMFGSGSGAVINSGALVNVSGTYSLSGNGGAITTSYSVGANSDISFSDGLAATVDVADGGRGTFSGDVLDGATVNVKAGGRGIFSGAVSGNVYSSGSSYFSGPVLGNVTVTAGTSTFAGGSGTASSINVNAGLGIFSGTIGATAHATTASATLEISGHVLSTADVNAENGATVKLLGNKAFDGGSIDNDGILIVNRSADLTLGAVISGTGRLTKSDGYVLKLTGNNDYTGGTTISSGTLQIGDGGNSGAIAGNVVNDAALVFNRSGTSTFAGDISGTGLLRKLGAGTVKLTGSHSHSGSTTVSEGTLSVNGYLGGSSALVVESGATIGGSGVIAGVLTGAGLVSPGNSPGILTASQFDPSGGLDAAFEFTALAPIYTSATASLNDITRLTNLSNPFASGTFTAGNVIDVYFNVDSIASGQIYEGGFFTGLSADDLLAALDGKATFHYWAKTTGTSVERSFNESDYVSLTSLSGITGVTFKAASRTANFGSGDVTGSVTQFVIIPEPDTIIFAGIGIAMAGWSLWRRRRISQMLRK